ncbi:MAG: hypothetical protein QM736_02730 [Vicinamibacterales bacterium]
MVALWNPRGELVAAFAVTPAGRVPMPNSAVNVYRVRGERSWTPIGATPVDMTRAASGGHVMVRHLAAQRPLVVYAARRERPLAPRLFDVPATLGQLDVQEIDAASGALASALAQDGWTAQSMLQQHYPHVYRIVLPAAAGVFHLAFGGIPDAVFARADGGGDEAFTPIDFDGQLEPVDEGTLRMHAARDHHQMLLGAGWSPIGADETGGFAELIAPSAEILLPCERHGCTTLELQAWTARDGHPLHVSINGVALTPQPSAHDWHVYRWSVPADAVHVGINSVVLAADPPLRLADLTVSRGAPTATP